jgi:Asp-tRNA(Asn)/Glu-tRNA(Gln) amidotransferase A subunit family amidase
MNFKSHIFFLFFIFSACQNNNQYDHNYLNNKYGVYISKLDNEEVSVQLANGLKPIALKDNIDAIGFANTAGSIVLKQNFPNKNAFLVQKLLDKGFFIQGKTNLSEWANFRSTSSTSGWSSMGGQTLNPYGLNRNPCGSSSGSAVAVALGMVDVAIGTETNGSISCPSSVNGVVGIKPTVGLVSRSGIIPISNTQDTAGPMALTVQKAAEVLEVIAGIDADDIATTKIPSGMNLSFSKNLDKNAISGKRFGLLSAGNDDEDGRMLHSKMKKIIESLGGKLIVFEDERTYPGKDEFFVLKYEFRQGLESYLGSRDLKFKTLKDLIDFNEINKDVVQKHFDQSIFIMSDSTQGLTGEYEKSLDVVLKSRQGIDKILKDYNLDALVGLSRGPAWEVNYNGGDRSAISKQKSWSTGSFAAMAGYPNIIIPLGLVNSLPVGMSFIGTAWSDKKLIDYAYAFEQENNFLPRPKFLKNPR